MSTKQTLGYCTVSENSLMEETFCAALSGSPDELLSIAATTLSRPNKLALKAAIHKSTKKQAAILCSALVRFTGAQILVFQKLDNPLFEQVDSFKTPSPKHKRRKRACSSPAAGIKCQGQGNSNSAKRAFVVTSLKACAMVVHFAMSHPHKAFQPCDLFPTIQMLHDQLVFFEDDLELQDTIAVLCESWWKDHLPGRESLIAQSLPFLLSKSLEVGRKVNVHRVYSMREAFTLFDFVDETIEDLKHLLMRCVLTPAYLRSPDGRRFISFLFNINVQLTKELIVMVRSQIPFGRKSILEAYGEILFRAWRMAEGPCLHEIEMSCVQGLIEGAVYASANTLASSIRKVLWSFTAQRTQEGVEALLFRLQEPILFRSLQVANSNVRRNALLMLIDMFPLVNPDASKEDNDILLDKQFMFLEKLLADPCPDMRVTAVEGICRVLRLFWEVVSSGTTVKLLSKVVDETAQDNSSSHVRCAVLQGATYLLDNPASHDLLKVLLPRLGHLLADSNVAVRIAMADMLLAIKGIRAISFLKVASMESLLIALEGDKPPVARRLTRLLIPSYFPSKVPIGEACERCIALIKRAPQAGLRFCEWAIAEGVPLHSLLELVRTLFVLVSSSEEQKPEDQEPFLAALNKLCHSLGNHRELKALLSELLTRQAFKALLSNAVTPKSRTSVVQLVSVINPTDLPELFEYCGQIVTNFSTDALSSINMNEARSVHSLMLAWGGFNDLIQTLVRLLSQIPVETQEVGHLFNTGGKSAKRNKHESKSPWTKSMKKSCNTGKGRKGAEVSGDKPCSGNLLSVLGAAWHVENLVEVDETRQALLAHKDLHALVSGLRNAIYCVMHYNPEMSVSEFLKASLIRAYATLTAHLMIKETSIKKQPDVTSKKPEVLQNDAVLCVCKELISWTANLQNSTQSTSMANIVKSAKKPDRKSQTRHKDVLSDISNTTPCGARSEEVSKMDMFMRSIRISNTVLESVVYFLSLKLVEDDALQDVCLEFATNSMQWMLDWLKEGMGGTGNNKGLGFKARDLLPCIRVCATHAAKMLYLRLRNQSEGSPQFANLANCLLDVLVSGNAYFGFKGAVSMATSLKSWMPDILISLSSTPRLAMEKSKADHHVSFDDLVNLGNKFLKPWVSTSANSVFESANSDQKNALSSPTLAENMPDFQENSKEAGECAQSAAKVDQSFSFCKVFLEKVGKLLRRGDRMILEGVSILFLWQAAVSIDLNEYSRAAGAVEIVCRLFLGSKAMPKKGASETVFSDVFKASCKEIGHRLDVMLDESIPRGPCESKLLHTMLQNLLPVYTEE